MKCSHCGIEKDEKYFQKDKLKKRGFGSWCKECFNERAKNKYKNNEKYRNSIIARRKVIRAENGKIVDKYLEEHTCKNCGESNPIVLDFHHRDPKEKDICVCYMMNYNIDKIMKEILKCDVLCSNCHRLEHHNLKIRTIIC